MAQAQEFNFTFHSTNFYGQYYTPKKCKATIVLVHGMGEHSNRYSSFVIPKLLEANFAVVTYDQFGHGLTQGKRGHNPGYSTLLDTLDLVISKTNDLFKDKPLFLYGHSMGGNVVINYGLRKKQHVSGIIATSPLLALAFDPPKWKMTAGKIIRRLAPALTLPSELDATAISRDAGEVQKYKSDPLVHDKISANYSLAVFEAGEWAVANAQLLKVPTLVVHGTGDQITSHHASELFVQNSNNMAQIKLFQDGYHELHNDLEKDTLMSTLLTWLNHQLT